MSEENSMLRVSVCDTQTQTLTREQAQRLRDDLAAALRALDQEEQRTD